MKFHSILLILFLGCLNLNAQEELWLLAFNNGRVIEAEMTKKGFYSSAPKIAYINKATGKKEKVASSDLATMTSIIEGDTMVYKKIKKAFKARKKLKYDKELCWATRIYETDKIEVYAYIGLMEGAARPNTYSHRFHFVGTAFKLTSEDYLFAVGPFTETADFTGIKNYSKMMNWTLKDTLMDYCPTFANKLHKKSYLLHEYKKIADDYTAICK